MRIDTVAVEERPDTARLSTTVHFDDVDREPLPVWFECPRQDGDAVASLRTAGVEPFVPTAAIVADLHGERSLTIDDPVDPRLVANLIGALALYEAWWPSGRERLEWRYTDRLPGERPPRTAYCMTGGVDSMSVLIENHRRYPSGHPMRILGGLAVVGLDDSTEMELAEPLPHLTSIARRFGIAIHAVRTNIRDLDPTWHTWEYRIQAAVLASAGHAALASYRDLLIAPSDAFRQINPYGTHPALDKRFGTTELRVQHEYAGTSRLDRLAIVVSHPDALDDIQVCNRPRDEWGDGTRNCGRCEKCIRTQIGLAALGVDECAAFAEPALSAATIRALPTPKKLADPWDQYLAPLTAHGRTDLVAAAEDYIRRTRRRQRKVAAVARLRSLRSIRS